MTTVNDGGPAFPEPFSDGMAHDSRPGMSLRDWFAGMALQGILASCAHPQSTGYHQDSNPRIEKFAYDFADMMLAEKNKRP